jgi:hypothetical protein
MLDILSPLRVATPFVLVLFGVAPRPLRRLAVPGSRSTSPRLSGSRSTRFTVPGSRNTRKTVP